MNADHAGDCQYPQMNDRMPSKEAQPQTSATAVDIERSIQALNKMAERLWGDGREAEAKALLDALDALNRALDRIRIGESRRVLH